MNLHEEILEKFEKSFPDKKIWVGEGLALKEIKFFFLSALKRYAEAMTEEAAKYIGKTHVGLSVGMEVWLRSKYLDPLDQKK